MSTAAIDQKRRGWVFARAASPALGLALACALLCHAERVWGYDPATRWHTLHSAHFRVHYAEGLYDQALDTAKSAEVAFDTLTVRLDWVPHTPIDIVLADETDAANGFAQSRPYNLIGLNAVAPDELSELADYNDWTYMLVAHELTHIIHIDTVLGIPSVVNAVFGRWLTPNASQPGWIIEGLATYFESALSGAGRVRTPMFDMYLRAAVLEESVMALDEISASPSAWPQGTVKYLYGSWFVDYLVRRFGEDVLRRVSQDYGGRLIPWAVNAAMDEASGATYPELYADFIAGLERRYASQRDAVLASGRREGELLTRVGQETGSARAAAGGAVYYVASPVDAHTALEVIEADGSRRNVTWLHGGAQLALHPDGRRALVTQIEVHDSYHYFGDLFMVDLGSGAVEQLTSGARAHGPDISADGRRAVFAQNEGVHSVVRIAPIDDLAAATTLADLGPATQVWAPRFSPDGGAVVFAGVRGGQRDIYRAEVDSGRIEALTSDRAVDGGPVYTPDGRFVLFHSDRDGIFNIYATPAAGDGPVHRVTRVLGGAFQPEPTRDGRSILYRSYSNRGFDVAVIEAVDPATLEAAGPPRQRPPPPPRVRAEVYPSEPYSPLPTLLPRSWTPVLLEDTRGLTLGASVGGEDAVGLHAYSLQAWWGISSREPGFLAAYANRQLHPGITVDLSRSLGFAPASYVRNGRPVGVEQVIWSGGAGAVWPLVRRRDWSLSLSTRYELLWRGNTAPLVFDPIDSAPLLPDEGRFAAVRLGLGLSTSQWYAHSISAADGGSLNLTLRVEDPYLGSQYSAVSGTVSGSYYLANPWARRHVLAATLSGGFGASSYRRNKLFAVSGVPSADILLDVLAARVWAPQGLRGFPLAAYAGDALVFGSVEYRLPLVDIEAGWQTLPIYLRSLHAAVFADAAAVADHPRDLAANQHYSAGAELRLGLLLGYGLPTTLRVGYGRGLGPDRVQDFFVLLGSGF